jgi:hemerythrin
MQDYPKLVQQKATHAKLVAEVLAYKAMCNAGATNLPIPLLAFLQDWLTRHIKETDKSMVTEIEAELHA